MRTGVFQKGQFNIKSGMIFIMPDLDVMRKRPDDINAGSHPWLITQVYDDYIEIVMCTTTSSKTENKHRLNQLYHDNKTDISHPCPPMDRPKDRIQSVSLDTAMLFPKKELFSHKIKLCNENTEKYNLATHGMDALCLRKTDVKYIQDELFQYQKNHRKLTHDPYDCEEQESYLYDLEEGYTVPDWFTKEKYDQQFTWKHLPKADWKAVYPFEDQMHDYEKNDPELQRIAALKSGKTKKSKSATKSPLSRKEIIQQAEAMQRRVLSSSDKPKNDMQFDS